ncbi:MAG TPA: BON domain-containing protein [Candidatus Sulfotelmatobacter sp.]
MKKKFLRSSFTSPFSFATSAAVIFILSLSLACAKKADDAKIAGEIQGKFSQDSGLSGKQLSVQASGGVVTLSGSVDNDAQRNAAARQAASVAGVKEVVNNLQVGMASSEPAPAPANDPTNNAAANNTAANSAAANNPSANSAPPNNVPPNNAPPDKSKPAPSRKHHHRSDDANRSRDSVNGEQGGDLSNQSQNGQSQNQNNDQNMVGNNSAPPPPAPADTAPPAPPPPPPPLKLIIDQGTQITVRLVDPIDSEKNQTGDTFHATLNAAITADGEEAIPAGTDLTGHLVDVKSAGKFKGQSEVVLQLDSISAGGKTYSLQTDQYKKTGSSRGKNTAEKVGGGAIVGGIIGAIAGGGKGAAIGSAAGAGVGGGVQAATKGQQIKLPSETVLNFILQAPVTVIKARDPNSDRQKLGNP